MSDEKTKEAMKQMSAHVAEAQAALAKAMKIADEHDLSFNWDASYGMGGTYYGANTEDLKEMKEHGHGLHQDGWAASSTSC